MNQTIELLMNHRSIRKFKQENLTDEQIKTIIQAGQAASTSSYYQAYTVIGITDEKLKQQLREVSGQEYVEHNGHLFVFCADLNRMYQSQDETTQEKMKDNIENTEFFMMATIDATLAAQNAAVASESLGLGICYLGSLRNDINRVNELLNLPQYVIPLFGMAVGVPDEEPDVKPRFDFNAIYHENSYQDHTKYVEQFNETTEHYYEDRSFNTKVDNWSKQVERKLSKPMRMDVTDFVKQKGFNKR
ncbi:oxygen-insensitive NADPH nitroreductase [Alkalibacillus haloalkaliphilus]|uniref:oxygen-insensitive NADPH nitroreductase n=1 Tax=Alkalibacillus haloalkaliphilus TaxID=94136 RepID=UPI0029358B65|nr:oxygen-insensitive NADPH nitroreductase [Alkalibacillus haloalkaliphilus]MDV2582323.1 oxygen-insensitive NADPH nitroreductase [Alkalibacillus haloalkaliphilus]